MKDALNYLRDRLAEPGTARSIAVVLFALTGAGNSQEAWEAAVFIAVVLLGMWSALRPER